MLVPDFLLKLLLGDLLAGSPQRLWAVASRDLQPMPLTVAAASLLSLQ